MQANDILPYRCRDNPSGNEELYQLAAWREHIVTPASSSPPHRGRLTWPLCAYLLFNGINTQGGWIFFGFGVIFALLKLVPMVSHVNWRYCGPVETTQAIVTQCIETGTTDVQHQMLYRVEYTFTSARTGISAAGHDEVPGKIAAGKHVSILYRTDHPDISHIVWFGNPVTPNPLGPHLIIFALFPTIGLLMWLPRFLHGLKMISLLRNGIIATGTLMSVVPTNMSVNDSPICRMIVQFSTPQGTGTAAFRSAVNSSWLHRTDREPQKMTVVYDADRPQRSAVFASLDIELEQDGKLPEVPTSTGILVSLLPALVIIGNGAYLFCQMLA